MSGDQIANLAYLGLLGAVIAGYFFYSHRSNMGQSLRQLMLWALIFVGVIAAYGLWGDISRDVASTQAYLDDGTVEAPVGPDGHYRLTAEVNGTSVEFIVDTGASDIVLSPRDAARVGIDVEGLSYWGQAQTANGVVGTAPVVLGSVRLGPVSDTDVRAVVNEGAFDTSLLGMSYLNLFSRIEIQDGRLILIR